MTVQFETLTKPELLIYAKEELGIELPSNWSKAEVVARIKQETGDTSDAPGSGSASEGNEDKTPTKVVINIQDDAESEKINYHVVGLNGRNYQIKKGVDVTVPYGVYDILNNAIETVYTSVVRENGRRELVGKVRKRVPFSVIKFIY